MGRSRYKIAESGKPHFFTSTICGWQPVFTRPETVNIVLDSWRYLQQHSHFRIYGYVILENHLHFIAQAESLQQDVQRFRSFTARHIIDLLKETKAQTLLNQLAFYKKRHKTDSDYQLWEEGLHPQQIDSEDMLRQKLEYMHLNPVKRGYVDDPLYWRYSSARNYAGETGLIEVFCAW